MTHGRNSFSPGLVFKPGKLYIIKKHFWMVYPTKGQCFNMASTWWMTLEESHWHRPSSGIFLREGSTFIVLRNETCNHRDCDWVDQTLYVAGSEFGWVNVADSYSQSYSQKTSLHYFEEATPENINGKTPGRLSEVTER